MGTSWTISGEFAEACSCEYLCPCITSNASARATEDFCTFAMTYRIDRGSFGDTPLDGVLFTLIAQSKAVMAEGGWIVGLIVDEAADSSQADAIAGIIGGAAGGPFAALGPMIAEFRGIERHPISMQVDGLGRSIIIPNILDQRVEGVASISVGGE